MSLKTSLAKWLLKRKLNQVSREVKVCNLDSAKTIGVLWSLDERAAFRSLQKIVKNPQIQFRSLYFSMNPGTKMIEGDSFSKVNLTWLGFPKDGYIQEFMHQKFDILIDLTIVKKLPLQVIVMLSNAHFKVGFSNDAENIYDLNLDVSKKPDAEYLVEQLVNYLTLINKA